MLILTRRKKEAITINKNITIKILNIRGNQVQLGIEAPRDVTVNREEVLEKMQEKPAKAEKAGV